jgi:uncharacterized RDD family membrane protein YckC
MTLISSRPLTAPEPAPATAPLPSPRAGKGGEPLDTTVRIVTPERIVFGYPLAGPFRRIVAYIVDFAFLVAFVITAAIIAMVLSLGSPSGLGLVFVAFFLLNWGYRVVFETFLNGQTLGKRVLSIRVVSDRGVPITGAQAVLRNVVGAVDGMVPFFFLPGLASMFLTARFQRLGDLAAGTMVVVEERRGRGGIARVKSPAVEALLPWLPLRIAAGPELTRALSDYAKRRERFDPAVRESLARPLARPLRARFGLPADSSGDAVLCAVYHRLFLGE